MEKNFENELGRKLNQRTIEPSPNTWERVKLQRGRKKQNHTYIYWVAAVAVVAIGISWLGINQRQTETATEVVRKEHAEPAKSKIAVETESLPAVAAESNLKKKESRQLKPESAREKEEQLASGLASADIVRRQIEEKITSEVIVLIESGKKVNPDDVDLLIAKARSEIAAGRGLSKQTDATALLKDSESELDENFRSGIIENIFKQKRIKVALSGH